MMRISINGADTRLNIGPIDAISPSVNLRPLFAILIAFAMLFSPLAMQTGSAMAMAPADHSSQMMNKGHCDGQPAKGDHGKSTEKSCCVAMCTAVAVTPMTSFEPHSFSRLIERPALVQFQHSFLAELPTPPPRLA
ncbi:hypothetical protein LVY65_09020 [Sphingomonas sp. G124]|uniref:DUF2946 domain-containing protein n=1 Tax=Sphingomonas cremea TaxID=2904799 RepID=A0A9X1TXH9_9SPHN|nr:hypothetical protein [Sphingomonas cremea]MCF2515200.1 hypothetical protein [Sphingomonas cremea]